MTTHTFKVGDRVIYNSNSHGQGPDEHLMVTSFVIRNGEAYYDVGTHRLIHASELRPDDAPAPTSPHTTRLLSALRSAGMHIAEATDHATRALSGEPGQVKNRHEVMSSAIANAARACAEAAYELGMEYVGRGR